MSQVRTEWHHRGSVGTRHWPVNEPIGLFAELGSAVLLFLVGIQPDVKLIRTPGATGIVLHEPSLVTFGRPSSRSIPISVLSIL